MSAMDSLVHNSGLEATHGEGPSGMVGMGDEPPPVDSESGPAFMTEAARPPSELGTIREDTAMEKAEADAEAAADEAAEADGADGEVTETDAPADAVESEAEPQRPRSSRPSSKPASAAAAGSVRRERTIESLLENDDLWDTDLEDEFPEDSAHADLHDTTGRSLYRSFCERLGTVPVKYFMKHITDTQLIMRYHGLGPIGTRAIAKPLAINLTITVLDLAGNWMEPEGGQAIAKMLEENSYITVLNLADNKLCDEGIFDICRVLQTTNSASVSQLSLAGNEIGDASANALFDLLANNRTLVSLDLSRNCLGSEGAARLGAGISVNDYIEELDLSGNRISGSGAVELAQGIRESFRMKKCNLAWNGFGEEGGRALAEMLRGNQALQELNVEGNRLKGAAALAIGNAVAANETLLELRMGNNFIYTVDLVQVVKSIVGSDVTPLTFLSLKDIPVDYEVVKTLEQLINRTTRDFRFEHGPILRIGNTKEDLYKQAINIKNPIVLMQEHVQINDFRFIERLAALDTAGTGSVTLDQFISVMDEMKIPYYRNELKGQLAKLDKLRNGSIFYGDFVPPERPRRESAMIRSRGAMT